MINDSFVELNRLAKEILMDEAGRAPISQIYMIGDNPAADIRGARAAGTPWIPVLVRTGVFSSSAANSLQDPADIVADDVLHFVNRALGE